MGTRMVYITAQDADQARQIARALVTKRLAACANIISAVESVYRWEGAIEEATECVLIAKTTDERLPDLIAETKRLHSYECPCIVALPIVDGHQDYLAWVEAETRPD